jgi:hypothetical protein
MIFQMPLLPTLFIIGLSLAFYQLKDKFTKNSVIGWSIFGVGVAYTFALCMLTVLNGAVLKFGVSREFFIPAILMFIGILTVASSKATTFLRIKITSAIIIGTLMFSGAAWAIHLPQLSEFYYSEYRTSVTDCSMQNKCNISITGKTIKNRINQIDPTGWIEVYFDKDYARTSGDIELKNLPEQTYLGSKDPNDHNGTDFQYVSKWYTVGKDGALPLIVRQGMLSGAIRLIRSVPIAVGLQGTPTYTENIAFFTAHVPPK